MRLIFICDLHTGIAGEAPLGIDLRSNFLQILKKIQALSPDLLVLGGDLCLKDGREDIYSWQKWHLDQTSIPYCIIPGNHDDCGMIRKVFLNYQNISTEELYFSRSIPEYDLFFLDTGKGFCSEDQQQWLKSNLMASSDKGVIIFMHHPPALMGVPFMDKRYALAEGERFLQLLAESKKKVTIFCGHYHVEKCLQMDHLSIFVTPSLYFQIGQFTEDMVIADRRIGYRVIDLYKNHILTSVHYLEGITVEEPAQK